VNDCSILRCRYVKTIPLALGNRWQIVGQREGMPRTEGSGLHSDRHEHQHCRVAVYTSFSASLSQFTRGAYPYAVTPQVFHDRLHQDGSVQPLIGTVGAPCRVCQGTRRQSLVVRPQFLKYLSGSRKP
jgi:hypothetical protein